ncbi:hypothetical protein NDU88_003300 [Pleurodeles waltl]|uniref:Uncharacterized protein n=1 Tax=Pleurodeles waltl TaxID=8319 RepID=A0AAV7WNP3_PLEWA|nr:hypothetical protein NDU88_003300 [Pleurodeles waltl]
MVRAEETKRAQRAAPEFIPPELPFQLCLLVQKPFSVERSPIQSLSCIIELGAFTFFGKINAWRYTKGYHNGQKSVNLLKPKSRDLDDKCFCF